MAHKRMLFGLARRVMAGRKAEVRLLIEQSLRDHGISDPVTATVIDWLSAPRVVLGLARRRLLAGMYAVQGLVSLEMEQRIELGRLAGVSISPSGAPSFDAWSHLIQRCVALPKCGANIDLLTKKPKIFFVSHEATRTGAPLILLTLIRHFASSGQYELFTFIDGGGPLIDDFRRFSHVVDASLHSLFALDSPSLMDLIEELGDDAPILAICNTANTNHYATVFHRASIPVITLVHEMAHPYTKEHFENIYLHSDKVVFPAKFVRDVAQAKACIPSGKALVLPQGLLNPNFANGSRQDARLSLRCELKLSEDSFIVLGCGTINARKGTDVFVSLAGQLVSQDDMKIHFVWLGSDRAEPTYSYWLKKDIETAGLKSQVHFLGERDDPAPYFLGSDVFVLTSREDPFPCVVHEAMSSGLPVIAFDHAGGAAEALLDGAGIVVGYGDVAAMARAVTRLRGDNREYSTIQRTAKHRVETRYRFADYYHALAKTAHDELHVPIYDRDWGQRDPARPRVFFFNRDWGISGVNTFTENLVQQLKAQEIDAELVFPSFDEKDRSYLPKVPFCFLHLDGKSWDSQWAALIEFVELNAPCILVPNFDYATSAISPALSNSVGIVGIVHSDDVEHYDHVFRLGRYWNRIVCVNEFLRQKVIELNPSYEGRLQVIPNGVPIEPLRNRPERRERGKPLRLVYCARLVQHQKRVLDLVELTRQMDERELPYRLTVIGEGGEYANLNKAWSDHIVSGKVQMTGRLPREAIFEVLSDNDVFLLVSAFEGLPIALIEAMGCGCVPIVSDTPSGIPDLVLHGVNGFRVPVGDMARFAEHVEALQRDPELVGQMSARAHDHVLQNGFRDVDMGRSYSRMLHEIWDEITAGAFKRPEPILWRSPVPNVSPPGFALRINN